MSPSQAKGLRLGIRLESIDKLSRTFGPSVDQLRRTKLVGRFRSDVGVRRHYLTCYANSIPGLWQIACRWHRRLEKGTI